MHEAGSEAQAGGFEHIGVGGRQIGASGSFMWGLAGVSSCSSLPVYHADTLGVETTIDAPVRTRTTPRLGFIGTSALASAVGVVVAALVNSVGVAVAGAVTGRQPVLYHNEVVFSARGSDLALAGGLIACLLVGAFFLTLYPGSNRYDAARLTTLWIVLHCFCQGFVQLLTIPFSKTSNASRAFATLDVPAGFDLVVAVAGVVGLLSVALASAPAFLAYAHRQSEISRPGTRVAYTFKLALVPGVAGPLLAVPFFLPDKGTGFIQMLPLLGLFTVATVLASIGTRTVRIGHGGEPQGFSWLPLAWLVVLLLIFQLLLGRGLNIPPNLNDPFVDPI